MAGMNGVWLRELPRMRELLSECGNLARQNITRTLAQSFLASPVAMSCDTEDCIADATMLARPSSPCRLEIVPILHTARIADILRDIDRGGPMGHSRAPGQPIALTIAAALADGAELPSDVRLPDELEELKLASVFPGYGTHGLRRTIFSNGIASLLPSCPMLRTLDLSLSYADTTGLACLFATKLPSLSTLRIDAAHFYPDFFDNLAASAPNLESLELDRCSFFVDRRGRTEFTWGTDTAWGEKTAGALQHVRTLVIRGPAHSNLTAAQFIYGLAKFTCLRSVRLYIVGTSVWDLPSILHALSPSAQSLEALAVEQLGPGQSDKQIDGFAKRIHARLHQFRHLRSLSVGPAQLSCPWDIRYRSAAVCILDALLHPPLVCPLLESLSLPILGIARTFSSQRTGASARMWAEIEAEVMRSQERRTALLLRRPPSPLLSLPAAALRLVGEYYVLGPVRVE